MTERHNTQMVQWSHHMVCQECISEADDDSFGSFPPLKMRMYDSSSDDDLYESSGDDDNWSWLSEAGSNESEYDSNESTFLPYEENEEQDGAEEELSKQEDNLDINQSHIQETRKFERILDCGSSFSLFSGEKLSKNMRLAKKKVFMQTNDMDQLTEDQLYWF